MYSLKKYPQDNDFLRKKSCPVRVIDSIIRQTLNDMVKIMYAENGIGLAAPQVGILKRLVVVDLGFTGLTYKMINPRIVDRSEEMFTITEGCLSVPEVSGPVPRSKRIVVKYLNEFGKPQVLEATELLSVCIQHEIDHLNGVLFIDNIVGSKKEESSLVVI